MASNIILVLFSLVLVMQLANVSAIRCYQCSSSDNKYCLDPPDTGNMNPVDCGTASMCSKLILNVFDKTIISRSCADNEFCKHVDEAIGTCTLCLTDNCNSSTTLKSSILLFSIALGVAEVARRIFAV